MKINILTLLLCLVTHIASSQNSFGLLAGATLSSTSEDDKSRIGFHAGLLKRFPFEERWYGQSALLFTQKGYKINDENFINTVHFDFNQRFDYLAADFVIGLNASKKFSLQVGAEGAYLLNIRTKFGDNIFSGQYQNKEFDFSIVFGAQFQVNRLGLLVCYVHGFTDLPDFILTDINGLSLGHQVVGKLRTFQMTALYMFGQQE